MAILGIDPGKTGALALLQPDGLLMIEDVPVFKIGSKTTVDHYALARVIDNWSPLKPVVWLEQVGTRPGEGSVGAFDFGRTYGILLGVCAAHFLTVNLVTPASWKVAMKVKGDKDESRAAACTMFPRQSVLFARKKDDGRAEAALIAAYGVRQAEKVAA
jgi:crossover junction endodeoxyribonuclease RuvC